MLRELQETDLCPQARRVLFRRLLDTLRVEGVPPLNASMDEAIRVHVQWATLAPSASFEQLRDYFASVASVR